MKSCPHCGQPLPETRLGVRLTPHKARIFDAVKRARDGILASDLADVVCTDNQSRKALKSHIWQINDVIADEGYQIKSINRSYWLVKTDSWKMWAKPFDFSKEPA